MESKEKHPESDQDRPAVEEAVTQIYQDKEHSQACLGSTEEHVFDSPEKADYWRNIYERSKYEGRHRLDPDLQWTAGEEKKLVRTLDMRIMLWVWIMFSSMDMVRRNANRAVSDNMLPELDMNANDFNNGQTIYLFCFLAAELPGGLISKKVGPDVMTPISICLWGVLCACQSVLKTKSTYYLMRALIGLAQGGFIPEMVLYLSYFYKGNELPKRLAVFWTAIPLTLITGSLLAADFLEMRGIHGWPGWRWLFLIEGLMNVAVGLATFLVMPASITETARILKGKATWLHGKKGWFTQRQEAILVNRILRDDPSKGDMNNRQHVGLKGIWKALKDVDLWPIYLLGFFLFIPYQPAATYISLILKNLGYSTFEANMLAAPGYALFAINLPLIVWFSEAVNERLLCAAWSNIWTLPFLVGLICIPKQASPWVRYALLTGVNGMPYTHAILVGTISRNANSVGTRAVSMALYNMSYQFGSIWATNIYRDGDKPYYYKGNHLLVGLSSANIILCILAKLYYIWRNKQKDQKWQSMSTADRATYIATTKDTGLKRLDARFWH